MYSRTTTYSVAFHWKKCWEGFEARVIYFIHFFYFLTLMSLWKLYLSYYRSLCHADTCTVMQKPGQITESRYGWQLFWIDLKMHLSWGLKFSTGFIYWEMWEFGLHSMHQFAFDHFDSSWPLLLAILKTKDVFLNVYSCFLPFCFSETYEHIYSQLLATVLKLHT